MSRVWFMVREQCESSCNILPTGKAAEIGLFESDGTLFVDFQKDKSSDIFATIDFVDSQLVFQLRDANGVIQTVNIEEHLTKEWKRRYQDDKA